MNKIKYKDIYFIEENINNVDILYKISTELNLIFGESQLQTLDDVKEKMYQNIKKKSGNVVFNFKYGQKSTFWKSLIGLDDVFWYGNGDVALLTNDEIEKL